ncbi:helix-turn-helix transcriptional regulator [Salipiger bermudensis]|uniref:helix-turn-helix transcriptional regulator n=1 Tax=Salipiger bermudensis TaxID=344736 RepID=UPI00300B9850
MPGFSEVARYGRTRGRGIGSGLFEHTEPLVLEARPDAEVAIERARLGAISIGRVTSTGHTVGVREPVGLTLLVPASGRMGCTVRGETLQAARGEALFHSPNRRSTHVAPSTDARFVGIPVVIPEAEIRIAAERVGVSSAAQSGFDAFALKLSAQTQPQVAELLQMTEVLCSGLSRGAPGFASEAVRSSWAALLTESLMEILQLCQGDVPRTSSRSQSMVRIARRAREYMNDNTAAVHTVADVARAQGISLRSLQLACREILDLTPNELLTEVRLERARRALLSEDGAGSVAEAAFTHGANHLGRFAQKYRERFGESPSETLSRRQQRGRKEN